MFIENKGCQTFFFLYKRTNNIEVKKIKLTVERTNLRPLRKLCHLMIG